METSRNQTLTPAAGASRPPWAARISIEQAAAVALLRLAAGVRACVVDGEIWLHGESLDDPTLALLKKLAPAQTFTISGNNELVPLNHLLPVRELPDGSWLPINELLTIQPPTAALNGVSDARVSIELIRDDRERPATFLLTDRETWLAYAQTAPATRLKPLQFAASAGEILIRGTPLPPLQGRRLYDRDGIIVPCGYTWSPAVDPQTLRRVMSLQNDEFALLSEDGSWQLLSQSCFVQARRSAIRLTCGGSNP